MVGEIPSTAGCSFPFLTLVFSVPAVNFFKSVCSAGRKLLLGKSND